MLSNCKGHREVCGFDSRSGEWVIHFTHSRNKIRRSVEFCHSTYVISKIEQFMGNGVSQHEVPSVYPIIYPKYSVRRNQFYKGEHWDFFFN